MQHPKQIETVHVETLDGELCIYDWERMEVHALNPTAATVWQLCDGRTTPQQMAEQFKGDLTPTQAEELVWLTLKRLEKANLLQNEVAKPAGRKVLTRREMLKGLGVAAVMLPVVSSIIAPGPIEAQSAAAFVLVLYDTERTYNGDLATVGGFPGNGRAGADAICAASANKPTGAQYTNFRAFLSVSATDEIRDMPTLYGVPTNVPIVGRNGIQLAPDWAGLLDGGIDATLVAAGSGGGFAWWSGSGESGEVIADTCSGWTSHGVGTDGGIGHRAEVSGRWIRDIFPFTCSNGSAITLLCIAY